MTVLSETPTSELLGTVLADRYLVKALLDEGGMGRVFLGEHLGMQKAVAIKLLRHELAGIPSIARRFEREAMAAANIHHPNIARASDFCRLPDGSVFLVMEYIQGRQLRDEIARGPLSVERALHIARQVVSALGAAHALDIVHRDLKPENVMLIEHAGDSDFVKVLDFGVAKVPLSVGSSEPDAPGVPITRAGMVFGTPDYMAPEQALGQAVDARADLYSLGVLLFELLAGVRPFEGRKDQSMLARQLVEAPPAVSARAPEVRVPRAVDSLLGKLLDKEPSERVQTAREVEQAIESLMAAEARRSRAPREIDPPTQRYLPRPKLPPRPGAGGAVEAAESEVEPPPARKRSAAWMRVAQWVVPLVLGAFALGLFWAKKRATPRVTDQPAPGPALEGPVALPAAAPPASSATDAQLAEARTSGVVGLAALQAKFPDDPHVTLALAQGYLAVRNFAQAVHWVERLLQQGAAWSRDERVTAILWASVQAEAARTDVFRLMRTALGPAGPELAYDLLQDPRVPAELRERARRWVRSADYARLATPDLAVASDLALASSCSQRQGLLRRAANVGGVRAQALLEGLKQGTGCSTPLAECTGCLTPAELDAAIEQIKGRVASAPENSAR